MSATRRSWIQITGGVLLAAAFLAANLPNLHYGRADNGDNARLAGYWLRGPVGLALWPAHSDPTWERRFFSCWHRFWELRTAPADALAPIVPAVAAVPPAPAAPPPDVGTTSLIWRLTFALSRALGSGTVDLLLLGLLLRAGCLAALLLIYRTAVRHFRERPPGLAVLLALGLTLPLALLLADPRYTSYFNSFYREGGTLLFALATVAALPTLSGPRFRVPLLGVAAAGMLLAGSASAHFFTCLLTAGALLAAMLRRQLREPRSPAEDPGAAGDGGDRGAGRPLRLAGRGAEWAGVGVMVVCLLLAGAVAERGTERSLRKNAAYHTLFLGAFQVSDDPAGHIAHLGLPPTALERITHDAFQPTSQKFIQENWERIGHRATARVLLREPALIARLPREGAFWLNQPFTSLLLISHEACDFRPLRFAGWTHLKTRLLPEGYPLLATLGGAALLGLVALLHRDRRVFGVGLALSFASLGALGEIAVSVFGDGLADIGRHLVTAGLFVDLILVLLLWRLALALWGGPPPAEPRAPHF